MSRQKVRPLAAEAWSVVHVGLVGESRRRGRDSVGASTSRPRLTASIFGSRPADGALGLVSETWRHGFAIYRLDRGPRAQFRDSQSHLAAHCCLPGDETCSRTGNGISSAIPSPGRLEDCSERSVGTFRPDFVACQATWLVSIGLHRVAVVPDPSFGFDDHEVEPQRQSRHGRSIRQRPPIEETVCRRPNP